MSASGKQDAGVQVELKPTNMSEGELQAVIYRLVKQAKATADRRGCRREPFFRPVTLIYDQQGETRRYSCFSRDISLTGIGLLHKAPLAPGAAVLLNVFAEDPVLLRGRIVYCEPRGQGWYLSSAAFVSLGAGQRSSAQV